MLRALEAVPNASGLGTEGSYFRLTGGLLLPGMDEPARLPSGATVRCSVLLNEAACAAGSCSGAGF